jgi:hypothetical protein
MVWVITDGPTSIPNRTLRDIFDLVFFFDIAAAKPKFSCRSPNCKVATYYTGTVMDQFFLAYFPYFEKIKVGL